MTDSQPIAQSQTQIDADAESAAIADLGHPYRWIILLGLVTAAIMEILDTTIINVALPRMMSGFDSTTDQIGWVSTGYILSNVIVLPMTAWLSGRFGRKIYLGGSVLLFIFASLMCGLSRNLDELVFWRIVQGAGGAALISTAQATLVEIFPKSKLGMVQAIFGMGLLVAPTIGPALGGWITDHYSWNWCFFINVPIGLISAAIIVLYLPNTRQAHASGSIDWPGIGLLAIGLGSLQYVLSEGRRFHWFASGAIDGFLALAVIALVAFVFWELRPANARPIVNLRVLNNRGLVAGCIIGVALGVGLYAATFLYPLFAESVLGFTPGLTGDLLVPGGIASGIGMILCGRLIERGLDPRAFIACGIPMFIVAIWLLAHVQPGAGPHTLDWILALRGLGLGFMFVPITVAAFSGLQGGDIAQGAALFNLARQLGGSLGIAVLTTYLETSLGHAQFAGVARNALSSYDAAFLVIALVFIVVFPVIFLMKRPAPKELAMAAR